MSFNLAEFLDAMAEKMKIFEDEYEGCVINPFAAWIDDDYVRVVFESMPLGGELRTEKKVSLWGFRSYEKIHSNGGELDESTVAENIFFFSVAGDFPAFFNKSDGVLIDWRNTASANEPLTLSEVEHIPGVLISNRL